MTLQAFVRRTHIDAPADEVFAWHERPQAFARLTPSWENVTVVERQGGIRDGGQITLRTHIGPAPVEWRLEHRDYVAGRQFRDVQLSGPFQAWTHTHLIEPNGPHSCVLEDRIDYQLPLGAVGERFGQGIVRSRLNRLFDYRHATTRQDLETYRAYPRGIMKVAISGATGMVGQALAQFLTNGGHEVKRLVRRKAGPASQGADEIVWDARTGVADISRLEGLDAVVHLAGESIANGRWTDAKKKRIRDSRIEGTRLMVDALSRLKSPPKTFVCASAIGFYGDSGEELVDESSPSGKNFLAEIAREWETEANRANALNMRAVNLRFGIILSGSGGALATMLTPFKFGLGGRLGSGRQYMSWITLDDVIGAIFHVLSTANLSGPVNFVTPAPVTNAEFTHTLGKVLKRPTLAPLPSFAAKLIFGQMGDELLLSSTRVHPSRLIDTNYLFRHPVLEIALRHVLGR